MHEAQVVASLSQFRPRPKFLINLKSNNGEVRVAGIRWQRWVRERLGWYQVSGARYRRQCGHGCVWISDLNTGADYWSDVHQQRS